MIALCSCSENTVIRTYLQVHLMTQMIVLFLVFLLRFWFVEENTPSQPVTNRNSYVLLPSKNMQKLF